MLKVSDHRENYTKDQGDTKQQNTGLSSRKSILKGTEMQPWKKISVVNQEVQRKRGST